MDENAILNAISGDSGMQAVIGSAPMRAWEGRVAEGIPTPITTPYLIATVVSGVPENTLDAAQAGGDNKRMQLSIFGATFAECRTVLAPLRAVLGPLGYEVGEQHFIDPNTDRRMIAVDWEFWFLR